MLDDACFRRSLEHWGRDFDSLSGHGSTSMPVFALSCVDGQVNSELKSGDDEKLCYVFFCVSVSVLCVLFVYSLFNDAVSQHRRRACC
jgi:hypothetical protein